MANRTDQDVRYNEIRTGPTEIHRCRGPGRRSLVAGANGVSAGTERVGRMKSLYLSARAPRDIVESEVQRIVDLGVTLNLNSRVDDIPPAMQAGGYAACPASTDSNAIAVTASVPITPSPNWARGNVSSSSTITARVAPCAQPSAPTVQSKWRRRTFDRPGAMRIFSSGQ